MLKKLTSILLVMLLLVAVVPANAHAEVMPGDMARAAHKTYGGTKGSITINFDAVAFNAGNTVNDYALFLGRSEQPGSMSIEGTIFWSNPTGSLYDWTTEYNLKNHSLVIYAGNANATEAEGYMDFSSVEYGYYENAYAYDSFQ